jgi:hypothetical protein
MPKRSAGRKQSLTVDPDKAELSAKWKEYQDSIQHRKQVDEELKSISDRFYNEYIALRNKLSVKK